MAEYLNDLNNLVPICFLAAMVAICFVIFIAAPGMRKVSRYFGYGKDWEKLSRSQRKQFGFRQAWAMLTLGGMCIVPMSVFCETYDLYKWAYPLVAIIIVAGASCLLAGLTRFFTYVDFDDHSY